MKQVMGPGDNVSGSDPVPAGGGPQPSWLQWRIREIVLQRMIEAISITRVNRALWTRATGSGQGQFNVGDVAEIHRPSDAEDASGRASPGTILAVDPLRGKATVKHRRAEMFCRMRRWRFRGLGRRGDAR